MTAALVEQVHQAVTSARQAGERPPGRATLAKLTGASEHQVRKVLADLASTSAAVTTAVTAAVARTAVTAVRAGTAVTAVPTTGVTTVVEEPAPVAPTRRVHPWPLLVIGLGAAVAVWSGWVGLGELTGFGVVQPLPGIWDGLRINTAVVLPLSVEAYASYALRVWLGSAGLPGRARTYARWSTIASLVIGAGAQVVYHLLVAAGVQHAPWPVVVLVATVPVLVLGLASGLAWLVAGGADQEDSA